MAASALPVLHHANREGFKEADAFVSQSKTGNAETGTNACHILSFEVIDSLYQIGVNRGTIQLLSGGDTGGARRLCELLQSEDNLRIKGRRHNAPTYSLGADGPVDNPRNDRALDAAIIDAIGRASKGETVALNAPEYKRMQKQLAHMLSDRSPALKQLRDAFRSAAMNVTNRDGIAVYRRNPERAAAAKAEKATRDASSTGLHFKKDGSLDMRFTSSKEAACSAAPGASPSKADLHYKKDGGLDMRFATSKIAVAAKRSGELHYKADGTLDMRYSSSKAAVARGIPSPAGGSPVKSSSASEPLHYKQDGTLDMRYTSSKEAVAAASKAVASPQSVPVTPVKPAYHSANTPIVAGAGLHYRKDGGLDMRYSSSKAAIASAATSTSTNYNFHSSPGSSYSAGLGSTSSSSSLHYKKDGTLDMRYSSSKTAVGKRR